MCESVLTLLNVNSIRSFFLGVSLRKSFAAKLDILFIDQSGQGDRLFSINTTSVSRFPIKMSHRYLVLTALHEVYHMVIEENRVEASARLPNGTLILSRYDSHQPLSLPENRQDSIFVKVTSFS